MARRSRNDSPDTWFHVMNRGIARRTIFECPEDIELFLDLLGEATEREEVEVHAYCLMTTHYHMLVRSPTGQLGAAMQRVQTEYSRAFNRGRRRDGPLVRGRYTAKEVDSLTYRIAVVRYIDRNPISAGVAPRAAAYPYGSARHYVRARSDGADWLERTWVEREVREQLGLPTYDPDRYGEVFGDLPRDLARLVEARLTSRARHDPLDDLLGAAPAEVLAWMRRKARLADGSRPGLPMATPEAVEAVIGEFQAAEREPWRIGRRCGWLVLRVGLARTLCGLGLRGTSERVGLGLNAVCRIGALHADRLEGDQGYRRRATAVASRALRAWRGEESD